MPEPCRSLPRLTAASPGAGSHRLAGPLGTPRGGHGPTPGRCPDRLRPVRAAQEATP
ncbi:MULTISPECIES: hypothetical protein [Streptosporangium]|uniref:Uncharacterized protein n=1 Tax=Streptosporangium brasiliense TaxID=47480 RepID=A0ABT9QVB9_9ACTN|nr:hypothetical protein [Streptosporangium brasiliense]MDP9860936.1 hypothetical protein [Streptosporangium brasiliense]